MMVYLDVQQVDDRDPAPALRRPPLHSELQRMTGRSCPACDTGSKPFPSIKELRTHVERVHRKRLCDVCAHVSQKSCSLVSWCDQQPSSQLHTYCITGPIPPSISHRPRCAGPQLGPVHVTGPAQLHAGAAAVQPVRDGGTSGRPPPLHLLQAALLLVR
jgi:hypothetical protein